MDMNSQDIITSLLAEGWREFPDQFGPVGTKAFAKSFPGHAECQGNTGKNKQVEIYYHPQEKIYDHVLAERFVVKLYGELPNGSILRASIEHNETLESILQAVQGILKAWDHLFTLITPGQ